MLPLTFGLATVTSLTEGGDREWLVADGCGGYASGTVCGLRTRREHGLFVPHGRLGLVALDPVLTLASGAQVRLGVHEWASGAVSPSGHDHLVSFDLDDGVPRWRWRVGDVVLEREVAARHGHGEIAVVHRLLAGTATLALEALVTWRDADGTRDGDGPLPVAHDPGGAVVDGGFRITGPGWRPDGVWHRGVHTRRDGEREDVWLAGRFVADLDAGEALPVVAHGRTRADPPGATVAAARARAHALVRTAGVTDPAAARLVLAADAFVTTDLVAGYPGPAPGPLLAYEGLFLQTCRVAEGRELLRRRRADPWLVHAVDLHVAATGDDDLAAELLPALDAAVARADPTPDALWINALAGLRALHARLGDDGNGLAGRERAARAAFAARFPHGPDDLLAWSLPRGPVLDPAGVAAFADRLTPLGLRDGDAVHPWLLGPWTDAARRAGLPTDDALAGLRTHLAEWGLGAVSETATAAPPHAATGRPFHAAGTAEALRALRACE